MKATARPGFRMSLRLKALALLGGILFVAMGTYLALAVDLISDDRLTYTFDLNQRIASTLSSQVRASMESVAQRLVLFGSLAVGNADESAREALEHQLLAADPDLVRVRLYRRSRDGRLVKATEIAAWERLRPLELPPADLEGLDRSTPLPLAAAAHEPFLVANRSLPPSAQLLTVIVGEPTEQGPSSWVVSADMTADRLQELFSGSAIYHAYLVDGDGVTLTHPDPNKVLSRASLAHVPVVKAALEQQRARSGALEFTREDGSRVLGAWARVPIGRLAVIAETDREDALAATRRLARLSALFGVAILLAALLASILFARMLTKPLQKLSDATSQLALGRYDVKLEIQSRDEIGELARDFRKMAEEIRDGQLRLIQSEKMAAFGQLGAGITHEVKNPLAAIRGFAQLALHYFDDRVQVRESLEMVESEADRCLSILQNFLAFARQDPGKRTTVPLNDIVAHSVKLAAHQIRTAGSRLHETYGDVPPVFAAAGQLQQVLLNVLLNAQQALGRGGNIWVTTRTLVDGRAEIEVKDDGPGIPLDVMPHIFEPFFTTREAGQGTGLGLSVSSNIVRDHGGEIIATSDGGGGAVFLVRLPSASAGEARPRPG